MCHEVFEHTIWITFEVNIWYVCVAATRVFNICLGATNARIIVAYKPLQCTPPSQTRGICRRFIMWVPSKSFMKKNTPHTRSYIHELLGQPRSLEQSSVYIILLYVRLLFWMLQGATGFFRTIRFRINLRERGSVQVRRVY